MTIIAKVTTSGPPGSLQRLITAPLGLDVWEVRPEHLIVHASEAQADRMQRMGFDVEQVNSTEAYLSAFEVDAGAAVATYHSAASLETDLRALADAHPEIAELHEIGRSVEDRPIWALRIGERRATDLSMVFMGCHHAREWIAVEVPYLLAEHLVDQASTDPVQSWLQKGEIWVAPMVNPDGHEYTRTHDRLWRKNRRKNAGGSVGVDPNRNYGYMWGTLDVSTSSHVPADETYIGPRAFSEPETRAVRDLVARTLPSGVLTYHSYSQLILYPWGYTPHPVPDTVARQAMDAIARDMQTRIRGVHGETYTVEPSAQLYPTAGDTTDWCYGEYDIPSFTIELRPDTQAEGGFILPPSQIQPAWEENRPAALAFIDHVFSEQAPV